MEHEAHLSFDELWQSLLHVGRNFTAVLSMAVCHGEKVAVFEAAEVGHRDPSILVLLVWVRGRLASLGCKGKLGDTVGVHLARVGRVV